MKILSFLHMMDNKYAIWYRGSMGKVGGVLTMVRNDVSGQNRNWGRYDAIKEQKPGYDGG